MTLEPNLTDEFDFSMFQGDFLPPVIVRNMPTYQFDNITSSLLDDSIIYSLCGFPAFCDRELGEEDVLRDCGKKGIIGIFLTAFLLLAVLIIISNILVIVLTSKYKAMRNRFGYLKLSLAMADLLVGINILSAMSAGYSSTMNMNSGELMDKTFESVNSPAAVLSGGILIFSFEASILHLLFMSIERFFAIRYPLLHRMSRKMWIFVIISVAWLISFLYSFLPAAFPFHFRYSYVPMLLVFQMSTIQSEYNTLDVQGPLLFSIGIIIPYILTVMFTALTGYSAWKHFKTFSKIRDSGQRRASQDQRKPEIEALKTTAIMILTYTAAKVPIMTVYMLFYAEILNCQNFSTPYTAAFFITLSNSFLNVAIYSFRDRNFKTSFKKIVTESSNSFAKTETRTSSA